MGYTLISLLFYYKEVNIYLPIYRVYYLTIFETETYLYIALISSHVYKHQIKSLKCLFRLPVMGITQFAKK
jgi:hypothetical protein